MIRLELDVTSADYTGTRATNNAYKTTFADGDAVGVFAVRNGQIVENINNRKFIYNEGVWDVEGEVIEYKGTEFRRMQFYAYYPYQEEIAIDPTAEEPFDAIIKGWKIDADLSGANYTRNDLMTSEGEAEGQRLQGKVKFVMQHRMGLVVIAMPRLVYTFTNLGIADYTLPVTIGGLSITANGETSSDVKPYHDTATDTYMILVKPDVEFTIAGTYTGAKEMEYTAAGTLARGASRKYSIKDETTITHTLAIGDYYCASGKIVSKDAPEVPEDCIGIVCYAGNPQPSVTHPDLHTETNDALRRDYPDCNHGLVIALNNSIVDGIERNKFANGKSFFGTWFTTDEEWQDKFVKNVWQFDKGEKNPGFLGYNGTALMEMSFKSGATEGCNNGWAYTEHYRATVPVGPAASEWYIPCVYDMDEVTKSINTINPQLKLAGGQELESNDGSSVGGIFYWTSNERNNERVWTHKINGGSEHGMRERGSLSGYFRMMIAF